MSKRGVVLLSGGLDSATVLAIARSEGFTPYALSFRYGQRHEVEFAAAARVASALGAAEHVVADVNLNAFGGSALTTDIDVPKQRSNTELSSGIPITYVPARNTVFLSIALAWAEVLETEDIFVGVNALDYSGYPDCRPEYIEAFERMANLATKAGVEGQQDLCIHAPLIEMTKAQIIQRGVELGVDYGMTHSCYDPDSDGRACGLCDSCTLRIKGFHEAGVPDPDPLPGDVPRRRMTYSVKEIFYTLQGEGTHAGRPAVFCRFAGCNLWNGREEDRASAICTFCDTDFFGVGPDGGKFRSPDELADAVQARWPSLNGHGKRYVVCTGGEPLLQLDETAVAAFHDRGFEVAIETNGTLEPPPGVDWICVSPKAGSETVLRRGDELKLVYPQPQARPERFESAAFQHFFLQPMDGPNLATNTKLALDYCLAHPQWKLSLQTHKFLGIR